mmetsp:Transcript_80791/g.246876  ORF Transcript_80791/g.246876 Transcript_80791/m.246876 type:complete len:246 (+) Transcript_80791:403-1140(+)
MGPPGLLGLHRYGLNPGRDAGCRRFALSDACRPRVAPPAQRIRGGAAKARRSGEKRPLRRASIGRGRKPSVGHRAGCRRAGARGRGRRLRRGGGRGRGSGRGGSRQGPGGGRSGGGGGGGTGDRAGEPTRAPGPHATGLPRLWLARPAACAAAEGQEHAAPRFAQAPDRQGRVVGARHARASDTHPSSTACRLEPEGGRACTRAHAIHLLCSDGALFSGLLLYRLDAFQWRPRQWTRMSRFLRRL